MTPIINSVLDVSGVGENRSKFSLTLNLSKNVRDLPAYRLLLPHVQVLLLRAKPNVTWETTEPHICTLLSNESN